MNVKLDRKQVSRQFRNNIGSYTAFIALIVVVAVFGFLTKGASLSLINLKKILLQALIVIVSAVGTIEVSAHGNIDLAIGGTIGVAAVAGFLAGKGTNLVVMLLVAMAAGLVFSVLLGYIHAGLDVPALFVGIVGLSIGSKITSLVSSGQAMVADYDLVARYDSFLFYLLLTVGVICVAGFIFNYTKIGKYNKAMGDNIICARYSGIHIVKYKVIAYGISGMVSGIAAVMRIFRSGSVSYNTGAGAQMNVMLAIIVGGISVMGGNKTKIIYAVIGAILLQALSNGLIMIGTDTGLVGLVKGIVFLFAAYLSFDRTRYEVTI